MTAEANRIAARSLAHAIWPPTALLILAVAAILVGRTETPTIASDFALMIAAIGAAATLAYSILLMFDALLFRIIASYEDEWKGGAAVDDILARMRLKPPPETNRPFAERAAGTARLAARQRMAFAASAVAMLLLIAPV